MNYILTMTLSGSCMFFLYLFQKYTIGKHLAKRWQYLFLKAVMLYYLIPLPYLAVLYRKIIKNVFPGPDLGFRYFHDEKVIYLTENYFAISDGYWRRLIIAGSWLIAAGVLFALQLIRYMRGRREILKHGGIDMTEEHIHLLENRKNCLNIRKKIDLYTCPDEGAAFTMGIRRPVIVCSLPDDPLEKKMLLEHELTHVKRSDILWKMAESIVLVMHWFNPIVYWFLNEFESVCETSCDEQVIKEWTETERLQYAAMLVNRAVRKDEDGVWKTALSKKGKKIFKRTELIMKYGKEKKTLNGIASVLLIGTLVILNSLTVLAYEEVAVAHVPSSTEIETSNTSDIEFTLMGESDSFTDIILYDEQFVDENGNIYPIKDTSIYANCNHTYQAGTYKQHKKKSDGSCSIIYYEGKRCTQCGNVICEKQISEAAFSQCIH